MRFLHPYLVHLSCGFGGVSYACAGNSSNNSGYLRTYLIKDVMTDSGSISMLSDAFCVRFDLLLQTRDCFFPFFANTLHLYVIYLITVFTHLFNGIVRLVWDPLSL